MDMTARPVMTGYEKFSAAFSAGGASSFPVVTCYTGIFERDHFAALTDIPWWRLHDTDPQRRAELTAALTAGTGIDWYVLGPGASRDEQQALHIVDEGDAVVQVDRRTGARITLDPPVVSGTLSVLEENMPVVDNLLAFLDRSIPPASPFSGIEAGREMYPATVKALLPGKCALQHVPSPLWAISSLLGYAQWFEFLATDPEPIYTGCRRILAGVIEQVKAAAAIGCQAIWIEECLTDQIGPARFARYNLPMLRALTDAIRAAGMWSIYYFCGNPWPVWDLLLDSGADALSLEESKKGFDIDIDEVVDRVQGRMTVFGNLDTVDMLEKADAGTLTAEVSRQLAAGRRNGGRFVMSTGSPITPGTTVARVREYVTLVRELAGISD